MWKLGSSLLPPRAVGLLSPQSQQLGIVGKDFRNCVFELATLLD
jgi:hypothetical protein